ncbi:hypothetical protein N7478_010861 [Penicillium angulare]|uniref:uncharacterized protein n=1 Tax=Penicillium angulare TaxID=116970 RepID=UPI00254188C5|nr:uncharacterized protein N7478_010861 [Penicillium angulare]KAJ5263256.1 hypothetical protein N7478_010861 [Penicillium angulare]
MFLFQHRESAWVHLGLCCYGEAVGAVGAGTASQTGSDGDEKSHEPGNCPDTRSIYSNGSASNRGHGTDDTLAVTRILEQYGIPCFLVGTAALVFNGTDRVRMLKVIRLVSQDREICVPTELVSQAAEILQSEPYAAQYRLIKPWPHYYSLSLYHMYHRLKSREIDHYFFLVPSIDMYIDYVPSNFTRSFRGLPYPKLDVSIKSCLDTCYMVQLCDVIDDTNVSEEWEEKGLNIKGTNDVEWAREKNKRGEEFGGMTTYAMFAWGGRRDKREMWRLLVRTKEDRLDWTKLKDIFITQYCIIGDPDSWMELSDMS